MNSNDWTQLNMNWFYWHKYRFYRHEYEWTQLNWTWISSVQSLIRVSLFATPWTTALQVSLSITNSWVYPNSCPLSQWCHLTISSSVVPFSSCHSIFPTIRVFSKESIFSHQKAKILESQLEHQCFQWTSRLISFRMDWLHLLAGQGTFKSLLQHHS